MKSPDKVFNSFRLLLGPRVMDVLPYFVLIFAGILVYLDSFGGAFVFDDYHWIVDNEDIRSLQWPWLFWEDCKRPILYLTLAINYFLGGLEPFGYHLFNLVVHVLSALCLMGIVARTRGSQLFALSVALIWLVHPLQTGSVTYIIQRAESLAGLFYLFSFYCAIRYIRAGGSFWLVSSVIVSILGGMTKETVATLPLVIFMYDRTFVSGTFRDAFHRHNILYAGLAVTWVVIGYFLMTMHPEQSPTAGFGYKGVTPLQYALTQPGVVLHYVRLIFWPHPLVLDYMWPPIRFYREGIVPLGVILIIIGFFLWAFLHRAKEPDNDMRVIGFLGLSFFVLLSPSSSFIPLKDLAFEHRMYLPLACVVLLILSGVSSFLGSQRRVVGTVLLCVCVGALGYLTLRRNRDYYDREGMWFDILSKRPDNLRANVNTGVFLMEKENFALAQTRLLKAMQIDPEEEKVYKNLGNLYNLLKDYTKALQYYQRALEIKPDYLTVHNSMGDIYFEQGQLGLAQACYQKVIELDPAFFITHNSLGGVYMRMGDFDRAIFHFQEALKINPQYKNARHNLKIAFIQKAKAEWKIVE